jgi:hypothetical protein
MDVILLESEAYKGLVEKIDKIARFIGDCQEEKARERKSENEDNTWVDSYEVCTFLKISKRTLQRLRAGNEISYTLIRGKTFYRISEIKRLLEERTVRRSEEHLQDLIKNHQLHVEQRRNLKANR